MIRLSASAVISCLGPIPELQSSNASDFERHSKEEMFAEQRKYVDGCQRNLSLPDGLWRNSDDVTLISDDFEDIQIHLSVVAHIVRTRNRGAKSTELTLQKKFVWTHITEDIRTFVLACIHCLSTMRAEKVPSATGMAVHSTAPNDLLKFDYIEVSPRSSGEKYISKLKRDQSYFKWLFTQKTPRMRLSNNLLRRQRVSCLMARHTSRTRQLARSRDLKVQLYFTLPSCP